MSVIEVRGFPHYYEWVTKSAPSNNKPVIVFIHGWGGSARYWQSTANALADDFDCLLYDMRGFGRSLRKKGKNSLENPLTADANITTTELTYELEEYADDLAALLDALKLERVYLNAHSMGASVATFFLNRYPERVEKAILTCSGIFEYDQKAFEAFYKFGGYVVKFRPRWLSQIPFADQMFMARFLHRPLQRSDRQAFLEDFLIADYDAALGTIFTSVSLKAVEIMPKEFAQLQVPTMLIAGQYDRIIPAAMGRQAASLNDLVEFVEIGDTAHFPMLEAPDIYLSHVREFLGVNQRAEV